MPNAPVHFEIPADDVARAIAFYEKAFGWKIKPYPMPAGAPPYYSVITMKKGEPGIGGGLMARANPGQAFTNYLGVKSVDAALEAIQANGGVLLMPKQEIPGGGLIALFKDTEGNVLGLHQAPPPPPKPKAKARRALARKAAASRSAAKSAARKSAPKKAARKAPARKGAKKGAKRR